MSSYYQIKHVLNKYLPLMLTDKILYQYDTFSTFSCQAIKSITNILKKKVDNYEETIIIIPKKYKCRCGNLIYKINAEWGVWWGLIICPFCDRKYLNK